MNIPDEAVQAAIEAIGAAPGSLFTDDSHAAHSYAAGCPVCSGDIPVLARVALTAAYPLIVAEVAERLQTMCHWHLLYAPSESHRAFHFGYECPYWAMAEVLRGNPDPREVARSFKDAR